jgi:hypothetical protein
MPKDQKLLNAIELVIAAIALAAECPIALARAELTLANERMHDNMQKWVDAIKHVPVKRTVHTLYIKRVGLHIDIRIARRTKIKLFHINRDLCTSVENAEHSETV